MGEGEIKLEPAPKERWIPINQLPPLDFYVGAKYLGAYRSRLEVDINALEAICRESDLPPIVLSSDSKYQPPTPVTPEMVGPGEAAFKKLSFVGPTETVKEKESHMLVFTESTTETIYDPRSRVQIPVGYTLKIRDRKMLYDYQQKYPLAGAEELERQFVRMFEKSIRQGIVGVAHLDKAFYYRDIMSGESGMPNQAAIDGLIRLSYRLIGQIPSNMLGLIPIAYIGRSSSELMKAIVVGIASMSGSQAVIEQMKKKIDLLMVGKESSPKVYGSSYAEVASNEWRKEKFPDRFSKEPIPTHSIRDALLTLIPLSTILKPVYITSYVLSRYPNQLVRIN